MTMLGYGLSMFSRHHSLRNALASAGLGGQRQRNRRRGTRAPPRHLFGIQAARAALSS